MKPERRESLKRLAKDLAFGAAIALLVMAAMQYMQKRSQRGGGGVLTVGAAAPAFELERVDAPGTLSLASLAGRPVLLNFWATWCGPCVRELPDLARLHAESDGAFQVVTVSAEPPAIVRQLLERRGLTLPVLWDRGGRVSGAYRVDKLPTTVILDAQGRIVHDFSGAADPDIMREQMAKLGVGD